MRTQNTLVIKYLGATLFMIMVIACKGGSPSTPQRNPGASEDEPQSVTTPRAPNTRTGLLPDPPTVKEGGLAFEAHKPEEKQTNGELDGDFKDLDKIPVAYITFKGTPEWCSGFLASDDTADAYIVVTAAHCFWDDAKRFYEPKDVYLRNKAGQWVRADHVFYERSDIDDGEYKDIGLIRLKNKPPIDTNNIYPIAVRAVSPAANAEQIWQTQTLKAGTEVYSWGYTSRRWIKRSTIEMNAAQQYGAAAGRDIRKWLIPTRKVQAFGGDSGGPLVMKINNNWHIVGVLQGDKGVLYTNESSITYTWIDAFMQNIWDANGNQFSIGMPNIETLNAALLKTF